MAREWNSTSSTQGILTRVLGSEPATPLSQEVAACKFMDLSKPVAKLSFFRLSRPWAPHQKFGWNTENNRLNKMILGRLGQFNEFHCE